MSFPFCMEDFSRKEIRDMLYCVTFSRFNKYPLTDLKTLSLKEKRIVNEILNDYIHKLPKEDWLSKLTADFNQVCQEDIFENPKIDYTSSHFKQQPIENFDPITETEQLKVLS